jgi:murein tripeptide amidase MpaA
MEKVDNEDITQDYFDYQMEWTSVAAKVETYRGVVHIIKQKSAQYWIGNKTELADAFKREANRIEEEFLKPESEKLDKFIAESRRVNAKDR